MRTAFLPVLLGVVALSACGQGSTTPSAVARVREIPADQVIYGLHHVMTKAGVRSSVLDSDTAYLRDEGRTFDLVGVQMKFYAESGAESGTLTAKTGEYDVAQGLFVAREDVLLVTTGAKGERRIRTEELNYQVKTDQLWSDKAFVMTEGGRTQRGSSFQSDGKFQGWTVKNLETAGGLPQESGADGGGGVTF